VLVTTPATALTLLNTKVGAQALVALLVAVLLVPAQTTMICYFGERWWTTATVLCS
jgi:hypothetical protein